MSAPNPSTVPPKAATSESIRIRQAIHEKYTVPKVDFPAWVLSNYGWHGDESVLDLGAGAGLYHQPLLDVAPNIEYHAVDISESPLRVHPALNGDHALMVNGDAQRLPYASDQFDVVMANHMLYHLEDVDQGLKEIRRVLKPEGVLIVATNSQQSMPELHVLMRRAIILLSRTSSTHIQPPLPSSDAFALESGCRKLSKYFYGVVRYDLPGSLVFHDSEPLITYIESTRPDREPQLPPDVQWDAMMSIMKQQINHLLNHLGELVINKLSGVLIASDAGGFIHDFVDRIQEADVER
jgi:SAM-dependent methyltransferase